MAKSQSKKIRFEYPFRDQKNAPWQAPLPQKLKKKISYLLPERHKNRNNKVEIWHAKNYKTLPLSETDFPLIFVVNNGKRFLRSFLTHYRKIGVTRFLCVDDASDDGTTEYLLEQPDVDVHFSNVRYREAARSKVWRELLAKKYGINRWYLNVDIDEYLFTGINENMSIQEYAKTLELRGIFRLPAPMIDMLPSGSLSNAKFIGDDDKMPWDVCPFFDGDGYEGYVTSGGVKLYGGPRKRLWGAGVELIKFPLLYWGKNTSMGVSIHSPKPSYRNFELVCGALLHFKIFSDAEIVAREAIVSKQYFQNGSEYKLMLSFFEKNDSEMLYENSIKFEHESSLLQNNFVRPYPM